MSLPQDRVALVTGAARGIGAATVAALAAAGWRVVAVDRCADDPDLPYALGTRADLEAVVAAAQATAVARTGAVLPPGAVPPPDAANPAGPRFPLGTPDPAAAAGHAVTGAPAGPAGQLGSAVPAAATVPGAAGVWVIAAEADVRDPDALAAAVGLAEDYWGGLDAAVAAAGVIGGGVPAWQVPAAQEQAVLDIDLGGVLNLARVCVAKAGVAGYIRALAVELGGTGITANAVSPGSTDTPILAESARLYDLPGAGAFAAQQPLRRLIDPAEVAAVLAFLASDGASAMTGAIVPVDGGLAL
jgi:NAD(P)-dependent dehydrogenase (short-subunit alcohol dehydrogenase family)